MMTFTSLVCKTATMTISNSTSTLLFCDADQLIKIDSLIITALTGSTFNVTVDHYRGVEPTGVQSIILYQTAIPGNTSLVSISRDNAIYLEPGDRLRLSCNANNSLGAVCSYELFTP
jgi:hypothetical protein